MNFFPKEIINNDYQAIVASWGGVGTTMLLEYVGKFMKCNSKVDSDGLKHTPRPPISKKNIMIVYVYGNPIKSLMSLFRRNHHHIQVRKLHRGVVSQPHGISKGTSLKEYSNKGIDYFRFEKHFDRWLRPRHPHPILFVQFGKIWENVDKILEFLNIEQSKKEAFPKKRSRKSKIGKLNKKTQMNLKHMYSGFMSRLERFPDVKRVTNSSISSTFHKTKVSYLYHHLRDTALYSTQRAKKKINDIF